MKSIIVFLSLYLSSHTYLTTGMQLPSYIVKCKRHDPKLNECMRQAFMAVKPYARGGIKELRLMPLNPYVLSSVKVATLGINSTLTDVKAYRAYNYNIISFKIDLDDNPEIAIDVAYTRDNFTAHYVLDGRLAQFPLHGEGKLELSLSDMSFSLKLQGKIIRKNGKEYLHLEKSTVALKKYRIEHFYLHDLFRYNPELTEQINNIIRTDANSYTAEIQPLTEKIMSEVFLGLFKGVFDYFSLHEIFD